MFQKKVIDIRKFYGKKVTEFDIQTLLLKYQDLDSCNGHTDPIAKFHLVRYGKKSNAVLNIILKEFKSLRASGAFLIAEILGKIGEKAVPFLKEIISSKEYSPELKAHALSAFRFMEKDGLFHVPYLKLIAESGASNTYLNPMHGEALRAISDILISTKNKYGIAIYLDALIIFTKGNDNWHNRSAVNEIGHLAPYLDHKQTLLAIETLLEIIINNAGPNSELQIKLIQQNALEALAEFETSFINEEQIKKLIEILVIEAATIRTSVELTTSVQLLDRLRPFWREEYPDVIIKSQEKISGKAKYDINYIANLLSLDLYVGYPGIKRPKHLLPRIKELEES